MKCGKKRASVIILQKLGSRLLDTGAVVRQLADGLTGGREWAPSRAYLLGNMQNAFCCYHDYSSIFYEPLVETCWHPH